ncbi:G-protein gamma-like domain-containing protein [Chlamydoabsidia padenii]|nr:G-protein gamma-like domain-containing protein [Chlamydoabsidia padenii]
MQKRHTREELAELKLRRLLIHNQNLKTQLELPRLPVSEASKSLIEFCSSTPDPLIPSLWGPVKEDPFTPLKGKWSCCVMM